MQIFGNCDGENVNVDSKVLFLSIKSFSYCPLGQIVLSYRIVNHLVIFLQESYQCWGEKVNVLILQ